MINTYLAFDFGTKRIGVAIGNDLTLEARGLSVIYNNKDGSTNWDDIAKLLAEYKIHKLILGLPLKADGSDQDMSRIVRSFAKKFELKFNLEVVLVDEFLTSNQAKKDLKYNHYHPNAKREEVDKQSAKIILEQYFNDEYTT
jgi:putative Holliday junction resolvase